MRPLVEVEGSAQQSERSLQAIQLQPMDTLGTSSYRTIPNVLVFVVLQTSLRPVEAQLVNTNDPRRKTGGYRCHIYVLTASPEGCLGSFEELGVLSHHLV